MPDPVINGRRIHRLTDAAGIMLYDDLGQERGGYVTFAPDRSIAITLSVPRRGQVAHIGADSMGGATIGLWEGNDRVELRADKNGGQGLFVFKGGKMVLQQPQLTRDEEDKFCQEIKDAFKQAKDPIPLPTILSTCNLHASAEACHRCFGGL